LQAHLLVEADLEIRQYGELCTRLRVSLEPPALVARKGLAQVALPLGRIARPQAVDEGLKARRSLVVRRAFVEKARELEADLLEHLPVAASHGVAGSLERVEGRVQRSGEASEPRLGLEEAAAHQPAPERRQRMEQPAPLAELELQVLDEVLSPDRAP
jgi:hypothetical protein